MRSSGIHAAHTELILRAIEQVDPSCKTDVVSDGVETLEYLFGIGSHAGLHPEDIPDLILLDLKMPRMDGLEVLQVLRRVRNHGLVRFIPVVMLTSSKDEMVMLQAYRLGANSYIEKPNDFAGLVEAVRHAVQYWLGLNISPPVRSHEVHSASLS